MKIQLTVKLSDFKLFLAFRTLYLFTYVVLMVIAKILSPVWVTIGGVWVSNCIY
jgi:hypothetical protein